MANPRNSEPLTTDRRLRRWDSTATTESDWYTDQVDPGAIYATVGGVADAGDLTVTIVPLDTQRYPTPDPIVWTWTAETLNQSAEGLYDEIVSDLASVAGVPNNRHLPRYLSRAEYTAATAVVRIIPNPEAPAFLVTMTGTGGTMTLTFTPDDTFPITAFAAKQGRANINNPTHLVMWVNAVTTADEILAIGTCTFDIQVLRVDERYNPVTNAELRPGVADLGSLTGLVLGEEFSVPLGGGRFGVRLTNPANLPATTDALEVKFREVSR